MKNLLTRSLTGAIFVAVIVISLLHLYSALALFLIISSLGVYEFYSISGKAGFKPFVVPGLIISAFVYTLITIPAYTAISLPVYLVVIAMVLIFYILVLFKSRPQPIINTALSLFSVIYLTVPFALFVTIPLLIDVQYNHKILLGFFILLWSYDTFAYLSGITLGKHKLCEKISPKKTWEGLIGGILFSLFSAWLVSLWFTQLPLVHWLVISAIISITGTLGDLTASKFKRSMEIKDSGSIFPGHGGIIDRFDSFLFAAPSVYIYLSIISI